jgi:hypothetical protein
VPQWDPVTLKKADGTVSIQFGGDPKTAGNFLTVAPDWDCLIRLYRPRKEILDGSRKFPEAQTLNGRNATHEYQTSPARRHSPGCAGFTNHFR